MGVEEGRETLMCAAVLRLGVRSEHLAQFGSVISQHALQPLVVTVKREFIPLLPQGVKVHFSYLRQTNTSRSVVFHIILNGCGLKTPIFQVKVMLQDAFSTKEEFSLLLGSNQASDYFTASPSLSTSWSVARFLDHL